MGEVDIPILVSVLFSFVVGIELCMATLSAHVIHKTVQKLLTRSSLCFYYYKHGRPLSVHASSSIDKHCISIYDNIHCMLGTYVTYLALLGLF